MSVPKYCPECGQLLSKHALLGIRPNTIRAKLYDLVKTSGRNGIDSKELFEQLYKNASDGGPMSGGKVLQVWIWQLNKVLGQKKQIIRAKRNGNGVRVSYYLSGMR